MMWWYFSTLITPLYDCTRFLKWMQLLVACLLPYFSVFFLFSLAILFLITVAHLDRITVKPDRTRERTSEKMPGLLWTCDMCFWTCQLAVWSSWASHVDEIILGLSEFARGFKFSTWHSEDSRWTIPAGNRETKTATSCLFGTLSKFHGLCDVT